MRIYLTATSETYPLSRKPAFIGINKANVSAALEPIIGVLTVHSDDSDVRRQTALESSGPSTTGTLSRSRAA